MTAILDKLGMISAFICAIHCLAIPVLMMSGFSFLGGFDHWIIDSLFITMGAGFIYFSIYRSYRKHRQKKPLLIAFIGLLFFMVAIFLDHASFHILFGVGGLMWACAHFYNHRILSSLEKK